MKKILYTFLLSVFLIVWVSAEYNPDKVVNSDEKSTRIMTTSIDYSDTSKTMHQSWDLNFDSLNDCENDWTCDDSIDYTQAKTYSNSSDFLEAEWQICKSATDWCNTVSIWNWELWAMTMMYCEDIYWENWKEKWSCKSYDEEKIDYMKHIRQNISSLTNEKAVLWWTWYVTNIDWKSDDEILVEYEDWHIAWEISLNKQNLNLEKEENIQMCTMQYAPVCWIDWKTYSNSCFASIENVEILYNQECDSKVNTFYYKKLQKNEEKIKKSLKNIETELLEKASELADLLIIRTKMLRIADFVISQRVTKYMFLKELINNELNNR